MEGCGGCCGLWGDVGGSPPMEGEGFGLGRFMNPVGPVGRQERSEEGGGADVDEEEEKEDGGGALVPC